MSVTPHDHREYVEGCYRCDLSRNEGERNDFETLRLVAQLDLEKWPHAQKQVLEATNRIQQTMEQQQAENERLHAALVDVGNDWQQTDDELRARIEELKKALRTTHGTAQSMADLDSWIAQECGMVDDGTDWVVPAAVAALDSAQKESQ